MEQTPDKHTRERVVRRTPDRLRAQIAELETDLRLKEKLLKRREKERARKAEGKRKIAENRVHHEVMGAAWAARRDGTMPEFLTKFEAAMNAPDKDAARRALLVAFMDFGDPDRVDQFMEAGLLPAGTIKPARPDVGGMPDPNPNPAPGG